MIKGRGVHQALLLIFFSRIVGISIKYSDFSFFFGLPREPHDEIYFLVFNIVNSIIMYFRKNVYILFGHTKTPNDIVYLSV